MQSYDIIGDVHGHAAELKNLLKSLGYQLHVRGYRHPDRMAVFVGDFVDRGPAIGEVVEIARAMVDAGDALAVMGNHEYNAIAFHTPRPGKQDEWFRPHSDKNLKQHQATLDQLWPSELADAIGRLDAEPMLRKRIHRVLEIAHAHEYESLVLGAWGCGAFANDPLQTAKDFREELEGEFAGAFKRIVFAITDWSEQRRYLRPFCEVFSDT